MAKFYDSFEKLKKNVSETYASIAHLLEKFDWGFFSEEGQNKIEAYAILDEAFIYSTNLRDLAQQIAGEIIKLEMEFKSYSKAGNQKDADEKKEVIKLLVRYIRHNLDEDIWGGYSEFDHNHYKRGC